MSFTKFSILFQYLFMKKLLISSKLFVSQKSTINLTSLRLDNSIHFLDTSSVIIGLELVSLNLCSTISENLLFLSFQKNPDLLWVTTWVFSDVWDKRIKLIRNKSPGSNMTDRQRLTWQQAFVMRVISSSSARWIFSLLSEQWWRERSADGVVTDLRVMQVREPAVAQRLLDEKFSGLWEVVVVQEFWLITCERMVYRQGQYSSLCEGAGINSLDNIDIEEEVLVRVQVGWGREEVNDGEKQEKDRTRTQTTDDQTHIMDGMKMEWVRATQTHWVARLEPCSVIRMKWIVQTAWKNDLWGVSVYTRKNRKRDALVSPNCLFINNHTYSCMIARYGFFPRFSKTWEQQWKSRASAIGILRKALSILDSVRMTPLTEEFLLV